MKTRRLGSDGPLVSSLGMGCMSMSEFYGRHDDRESLATIHRALDLGINFLDTADIYGLGHNEELVGQAIRGRRNTLVVASKFGILRGPSGTFVGVNGRPEYVRAACEASLRRLGIERIDLYYQHRVDPHTPIEDTVGAMARLIEEGKIRWLGLSEASVRTVRRAHAVHPITALQTEYSLWSREPERALLQTCRDLGIGFVAYSPLGRGFLTTRIRSVEELDPEDARRHAPRFQHDNVQKNRTLLEGLAVIAKDKGCQPAQLVLAWLLSRGNDIVPIPGTRRLDHLDDNLQALHIRLTEQESARLDALAPPGATAGARYPDAMMAWLDHEAGA